MRNSQTTKQRRQGASTLEAIVALTLLNTVLAVATPLVVRHGRMMHAQQHYRLALDELSNQHDRLTLTPDDEFVAAVEAIRPSRFIVEHLPGAQLRGEVHAVDGGQRVTLRISWAETNRSAAPLTLTAWRYAKEAE